MSIKALKVAKAALKTPGVFAGGVAFGTFGLKLLASKDAKKGYSVVLSKLYKAKDGVEGTVSNIKQHADDIVADAKDLYEKEKRESNLQELEAK
ncbi:DUF6110 family protein [Gemella haemolysans]|uniref:DUF6110 family protein n=1 Tax=Gemella haemolysans TaxID=1379 RepID=UPI00195E57D3|nr:DUF6110 family protein [Gemella haemolysans]VTX73956.1 Uncharacterised protein [Gemella haemolysans]